MKNCIVIALFLVSVLSQAEDLEYGSRDKSGGKEAFVTIYKGDFEYIFILETRQLAQIRDSVEKAKKSGHNELRPIRATAGVKLYDADSYIEFTVVDTYMTFIPQKNILEVATGPFDRRNREPALPSFTLNYDDIVKNIPASTATPNP